MLLPSISPHFLSPLPSIFHSITTFFFSSLPAALHPSFISSNHICCPCTPPAPSSLFPMWWYDVRHPSPSPPSSSFHCLSVFTFSIHPTLSNCSTLSIRPWLALCEAVRPLFTHHSFCGSTLTTKDWRESAKHILSQVMLNVRVVSFEKLKSAHNSPLLNILLLFREWTAIKWLFFKSHPISLMVVLVSGDSPVLKLFNFFVSLLSFYHLYIFIIRIVLI